MNPVLRAAVLSRKASVPVAVPSTYEYLEVEVSTNFGNLSNTRIPDVRWLVDDTEYPTVTMTANDAPSPLVASASATVGGYFAYSVYNKVTNPFWLSNGVTGYVRLYLGAGNGIRPTAVRILVAFDTASNLKSGTFRGSNDGVNWTELGTFNRTDNTILDQTFALS